VLQKHFAGASKMLVAVLQQHAESGSQALMKATLNCVTHLLVAQDPAAWDASGAATLFRGLLEFSADRRAKVRREAQNGVGMLVKSIRQTRPNHPIMESTSKFVLQGLKGVQKDSARTMYVLNILKDVRPSLPVAYGRQAAEALLVLMSGGVQMVYESCMAVFQALFKSPDMTMPPALLRRLLTVGTDTYLSMLLLFFLHLLPFALVLERGVSLSSTTKSLFTALLKPHPRHSIFLVVHLHALPRSSLLPR